MDWTQSLKALSRTLLSQLAGRGICVVVSSHTLSDLERLAHEFVLMHQGRIVAEGPLSEIERNLGLKATLDIAGLGPAPTQFGDDIEVEEIDKQEGRMGLSIAFGNKGNGPLIGEVSLDQT